MTDSSIEVNYLETLVYLNLDFVDGFKIQGINVAPRQSVRTAHQVYEVEGYRCKYVPGDGRDRSETVPLTDIELQNSLQQGEVIQICVRPTEDARLDGIKMRSIDSFQFESSLPRCYSWQSTSIELPNGVRPCSMSM